MANNARMLVVGSRMRKIGAVLLRRKPAFWATPASHGFASLRRGGNQTVVEWKPNKRPFRRSRAVLFLKMRPVPYFRWIGSLKTPVPVRASKMGMVRWTSLGLRLVIPERLYKETNRTGTENKQSPGTANIPGLVNSLLDDFEQ